MELRRGEPTSEVFTLFIKRFALWASMIFTFTLLLGSFAGIALITSVPKTLTYPYVLTLLGISATISAIGALQATVLRDTGREWLPLAMGAIVMFVSAFAIFVVLIN